MAIVPPPADYRFGYNDWIDPRFSETWHCMHKNPPRGHTTVYSIYDANDPNGGYLYIGMTGNLAKRFAKHRATKTWWGDSENCSLECYDTWGSAWDAEAEAIRSCNPKHNIVRVLR